MSRIRSLWFESRHLDTGAPELRARLAALPDDEGPITLARWRREVRASAKGGVDPDALAQIERLLAERGLVAVARGKVRRLGRHFMAVVNDARRGPGPGVLPLFAQGPLPKRGPPHTAPRGGA